MDFSLDLTQDGETIKSSADLGDAKDSTAVNSIEVGSQPDYLRTIFRHCADRWYVLLHPPGHGLPRVYGDFNKRNRIL